MKKFIILLITLIFKVAVSYCQPSVYSVGYSPGKEFESDSIIQNLIFAGQQTGCGIIYSDVIPDIYIGGDIDPFMGGQGYEYLDLDLDSINDFKIDYYLSAGLMQGMGYEGILIKSLNGNSSICVLNGSYIYEDSIYNTNLADTLLFSNVIDSTKQWASFGYLYAYHWDLAGNSYRFGYWPRNHYYIGVRVLKGNEMHYGWIKVDGMRLLTEFAYTDSCYSSIATPYSMPKKLTFSPNPFSNSTSIVIPDEFRNSTLVVFNAFGQIVKRVENVNENSIILYRDFLPSGIYLYQLMQNNKVITSGKFLINDN